MEEERNLPIGFEVLKVSDGSRTQNVEHTRFSVLTKKKKIVVVPRWR